MNVELFDNTKLAAYFVWEVTGCANALALWYCAEDTAGLLERMGVRTAAQIDAIVRLGQADPGYVSFLRHIAFRLYIYTGCADAAANWYAAERLAANTEWRRAMAAMAGLLHASRETGVAIPGIKLEAVRAYYR